MMQFVSFLVGLVFAVGLGISGMTQPSKVIGFLDVFGNWDPSLVFVMGGAVVVYFFSFRFARRPKPFLASRYILPKATQVDRRLLVGAALFGIGWGLSGFCPGPALTSIGGFSSAAAIFLPAMLAGMLLYGIFARRHAG